jgi:hypothetical protein
MTNKKPPSILPISASGKSEDCLQFSSASCLYMLTNNKPPSMFSTCVSGQSEGCLQLAPASCLYMLTNKKPLLCVLPAFQAN